jgi:N-acetyl-anhydromuramyl-L-alanine amidase AmpD
MQKVNKKYLGTLPCRSRKKPISYGIIHAISYVNRDEALRYNIDKCVELFKEFGVSAHVLIDRDGTRYELVPDEKVAYHAGKSFWQGTSNLNYHSLGVELIGCYEGKYLYEGFTNKQYESLVEYAKEKSDLYGLTLLDWLGHEQVSPGRKRDPGPMFNWARFRKMMAL